MKNTNNKILILSVLAGSIYFAQNFESLPMLGLSLFCKDTLHWGVSDIAYMGSIIGVAWLIKPIFGFFIERFFTNKTYIIASLIASCVFALVMAILPIPIWYLIGMLAFANTFTAMRDVSIDGIVCTQGKESNDCGNIQSIQWACSIGAGIITSLAGGYIAEHYSYRLSFALIIPAYLIALWIALMYKESNKVKDILGKYVYRVHVKKSLWYHVKSYKILFTNKTFLVCALMVFIYHFSPRFSTALFFVQRDSFHWSATFIGIITAIDSFLSVVGCLLYWKFNKKFNVHKMFLWSIPAGFLCNICYLYYTPTFALIYVVYGFFWIVFGLNCLTYMTNNTIKGKETTSFALLCAVSNIGGMVSNISGGWLFDIVGLNVTIIIASICPFLIIPLLKYTKNKVE